jgi:PmbA protein
VSEGREIQSDRFTEKLAELKELTALCLAEAKRRGANGAEVGCSVEKGLSLTVRLGEVETVEHHRSQGLGVTVYFGQRKGSASTNDLSRQALTETVSAACHIAHHAAEDPCAGLPDPDTLARELPELDLYHPWELTAEQGIDLALACENEGRVLSEEIINSEGASVDTFEGLRVLGNSLGFLHGYATSRHSLACCLIGERDGSMQREDWWTVARVPGELESPEQVGRKAAERTLRRLGARHLRTRCCPVLFAAEVAASLLGHFVAAVRGSNLYRKSSFLLDHLGQSVFPAFLHIHEQPHLPRGLGSAPYDAEGVATRAHDLVRNGVLKSYVLSTYSARKLGMRTTGNAGGVHNLIVDPGDLDFAGLLRSMDTGLVVTELLGQGVNLVTGDYSRGAAGFWVEKGEIQYPVEEVTIAGNLASMYKGIVAVGNDVDLRGNIRTGSILIDSMTVAGH